MATADLLALTATLVDIPSVSRHEAALADWLMAELAGRAHLDVHRVGNNVVARTDRGRSQRLILAGHTDTVPPDGNARAVVDGDRLDGVGSADMKSGLAVMVDLARAVIDPVVDVTYVFYAREEIASAESGLLELFDERPELLRGDAAVLGEPTDGSVEAGCQGTLRMRVELRGSRAHTARPWMGRNAIHRAGRLLAALEAHQPRQPVLDGCQFREALQAVHIEGGVAGNVVPDRVEVRVNHRFAPDRSLAEAQAEVLQVLGPHLDEGDTVELVDGAPGAPPSLDHPLLAGLVTRNDLEVRAKLGWTDVARFAEHGIPAANFGPGDSTLAHTAGEHVERSAIEAVHAALHGLVTAGP